MMVRTTFMAGNGPDKFVYQLVGDLEAAPAGHPTLPVGAWNPVTGDTVWDFQTGTDTLDLSELAVLVGGEFAWSGETPAPNSVWTEFEFEDGDFTIVYADTTGDGTADVAIRVKGNVGPDDIAGVDPTADVGGDAAVNIVPAVINDADDGSVQYTICWRRCRRGLDGDRLPRAPAAARSLERNG